MSASTEHPLDFLKDFKESREEDIKTTGENIDHTVTAEVEPIPIIQNTCPNSGIKFEQTENIPSLPKPIPLVIENSPKNGIKLEQTENKSAKRKGKKRLVITKKELQKNQIREKRRQERQVIVGKCGCHLSCSTKITFEQREVINRQYWQMEHIEQKKFVRTHSVQGQVKRRRVPVDPLGGNDVKKAYTYAFYLPDDKGDLRHICCTFFLNTLGFRKGCGNHIYRAHMREDLCDKRGKYERDHSLRDAVWDDILSYSPRTYHKGLKYSATALYLPMTLNAKMMHAYFKTSREAIGEKPGSASFYCAILREMDVHFVEMDDFQIPERKPIQIGKSAMPPKIESSPEELSPQNEQPPLTENKLSTTYEHTVIAPQFEQTMEYGQYDHRASIDNYQSDSKVLDSQYGNVANDSAPTSHQVNSVKQEPYYSVPTESLSLQESQYVEENDDYSDSYSNMDYSQSSYQETPACDIVIPEEPKVEPAPEIFDPHQEHFNSLPVQDPPAMYSYCPAPGEPDNKFEPPKQPPENTKKSSKSDNSTVQLSEEYPPVKRTKKYIAKQRNIAKRKRSHPVLHLECNCHLNCKEKINPEQQQRINEQYWSLGFCDQRMFMLEHTERHSIKRRRAKISPGSTVRKGYTYSYRLTDENWSYQPVCCQFFLNTIGFGAGSGNVIYRAHQVELSEAISDKRGKFARDTTMRDSMDDDIISYFSPEQQESGQLDLTATSWSPKKMYTQYVQRQAAVGNDKPGSFGFYWRRVKEMKVQFAPRPEPKATAKKKCRPSDSPQKQAPATISQQPLGYHQTTMGYGIVQ